MDSLLIDSYTTYINFIISTNDLIRIELSLSKLSFVEFAAKLDLTEKELLRVLTGRKATTLQQRAYILSKLNYKVNFSFERIENEQHNKDNSKIQNSL